jgi:hypothetical protein
MPDFREQVVQSWSKPVSNPNKARVLHIKLARLAKALKKWHKQKIKDAKREAIQAHQLVLSLEQTQDERQLTTQEQSLHKEAKNRILGMAAINRIRIRQRSRLTWIRAGDANTAVSPACKCTTAKKPHPHLSPWIHNVHHP